jgi:hypothetical protein
MTYVNTVVLFCPIALVQKRNYSAVINVAIPGGTEIAHITEIKMSTNSTAFIVALSF